MTEELRVALPFNSEANDLEEEVRSTLIHYQHELKRYFERLIDHQDARTTVLDDSMCVNEVSIDDGEGVAFVEFSTEFYAGCRDINSIDGHEGELALAIEGDHLVVTMKLPPPSQREPDEY